VYYISNVFISREEKKMKRREENLKERRENEEIQKGRCSQFSFFVQEDVRKRHQKKKERRERKFRF